MLVANCSDQLLAAGLPVAGRLAADFRGTDISVELTDVDVQIVAGDPLASAPIVDPSKGDRIGALTVVGPAASTNAMLVPVTQRAAREIEERLAADARRERVPDEQSARSRRHDFRSRRRPAYGWASLTEAERSLAELIAGGLTNKQAAARLFVSRHTVDSHLRHIFRKLDINSRVELARMVAMQSHAHADA